MDMPQTLIEIEVRVAKTEEACRLYNEVAVRRKAVAALHLTC